MNASISLLMFSVILLLSGCFSRSDESKHKQRLQDLRDVTAGVTLAVNENHTSCVILKHRQVSGRCMRISRCSDVTKLQRLPNDYRAYPVRGDDVTDGNDETMSCVMIKDRLTVAEGIPFTAVTAGNPATPNPGVSTQ